MVPNVGSPDEDGCGWICLNPDYPEPAASELEPPRSARRRAYAPWAPESASRHEILRLPDLGRRLEVAHLTNMIYRVKVSFSEPAEPSWWCAPP